MLECGMMVLMGRVIREKRGIIYIQPLSLPILQLSQVHFLVFHCIDIGQPCSGNRRAMSRGTICLFWLDSSMNKHHLVTLPTTRARDINDFCHK